MGKVLMAVAASACLAGCAGANYANLHYQGVPFRDVSMTEGTYRVIEKRGQNRMLVMAPSPSTALGLIDTAPAASLYEAAANRYLVLSGRPECRAVTSNLLVQAEFEVFFTCRGMRS